MENLRRLKLKRKADLVLEIAEKNRKLQRKWNKYEKVNKRFRTRKRFWRMLLDSIIRKTLEILIRKLMEEMTKLQLELEMIIKDLNGEIGK